LRDIKKPPCWMAAIPEIGFARNAEILREGRGN
jgi:hypothetical protein